MSCSIKFSTGQVWSKSVYNSLHRLKRHLKVILLSHSIQHAEIGILQFLNFRSSSINFFMFLCLSLRNRNFKMISIRISMNVSKWKRPSCSLCLTMLFILFHRTLKLCSYLKFKWDSFLQIQMTYFIQKNITNRGGKKTMWEEGIWDLYLPKRD